jgi:hypothetical protein
MIVALLRFLARLLAVVLLAVIAVGGIVVAVFCLRGDEATLSLSHLCHLLSLDDFAATLGGWLETLEADGPVAALAALCGAGAVLIGLGLIVGALVPRRERLLIISREERGTIAARRRAVGSALGSLAERPRDVLRARARVKPSRGGSGGQARLRLVTATHADERPDAEAARADLDRFADSMSLRLARRVSHPRRGGRAL